MDTFLLILALLLSCFLAYLIGSINFAIIVTRLFAHKDIRDYGSGNAGMTNVLRTVGKLPALLVTIGDFCKGMLAVFLGHLLLSWIGGGVPFYADYLIALLVMLGHCFPVFYGFKGGKGILVSAGVIVVLNWKVFLVILAVFILVVAVSRIVSLASISAAVAFPIATLIFALTGGAPHPFLDTLSALIIGGIVIFMHRGNIKRLLNGTENKLGQKKKQ
ncbi:MAG TPA: glycerol-3-phosphate 1-O-acyltransferase PlsY [Candidatus Merdivicinus intestinigallinarum]|nr:glycerol-3-phosphate 1-O-acyltransferase PlsY [Candidatus Merdivicinus intestinigallinarum]